MDPGRNSLQARPNSNVAPYRVTGEVFRNADPEAVFMHCLPAHRGEEVESDIIDGARSVVFQQAGNRLHALKILLEILVGDNNGA